MLWTDQFDVDSPLWLSQGNVNKLDLLTSRAFERVARLWARSAIVRARSASERARSASKRKPGRAGSYHTRPENQANDFEKVYYTSISDACPFCCGVNLPIGKLTIQLQEIEDTQHGYLVSSHLTVSLSSLHLMWSSIFKWFFCTNPWRTAVHTADHQWN